MSKPLFSISSRGRLRNRTKSKIIGFSKTARWISMTIKLCGHFLILFQLRISKAQKLKKIDFLKILTICTCKVDKNPQIFNTDFEVFYNSRWKYIKNWLLPLIFSEFHQAVFEKPIIFDFDRLLSWPRDEIKKVARPFASQFLFLLDEKNRLAISEIVNTQSLQKVLVNLKNWP